MERKEEIKVKEQFEGASTNKQNDEGRTKGEHQIELLRQLMLAERTKNNQRRRNNACLRKHLGQLQVDYLALQRELLDTLELAQSSQSNQFKQIEVLEEAAKVREKLIDQLRLELEQLEPEKVAERHELLAEQKVRQLNLDFMEARKQVDNLEKQLVQERKTNADLIHQNQARLDEQSRLHSLERQDWSSEYNRLDLELERLLSEPRNQQLKQLREERNGLVERLDQMELAAEEAKTRLASLASRAQALAKELELADESSREELERQETELCELRKAHNQLSCQLADKNELSQVLQFKLQRGEKRLKAALTALKARELASKRILSDLQVSHELEFDKAIEEKRQLERELASLRSDLEVKNAEFMTVNLDHENQIHSVRDEYEQRLSKLKQEHQKADRALEQLELKLARQVKQQDVIEDQMRRYQKEAESSKLEVRRLTLDLSSAQAMLKSKQRELELMTKEANDQQQVEPDKEQLLEQSKRHEARLDANLKQLADDNNKLKAKLELSETELSHLSQQLNKEHAKMVLEYEKRLENIRQEQCLYERNRIRYKKYGFKLKKYCEHLRLIHGHLCNPRECGYLVAFSSEEAKDDVDKSGSSSELEEVEANSGPGKEPEQSNKFSIKRVGQPNINKDIYTDQEPDLSKVLKQKSILKAGKGYRTLTHRTSGRQLLNKKPDQINNRSFDRMATGVRQSVVRFDKVSQS